MNFDEIIEMSLVDDDIEFPTKGTYHAERRKAKEHKKNALGRKVRHSNEWINGYITSKGKDGKKSTRWIKDIIKENAWDEFDSIDWSRVKGINPKNYGHKQYDKRPRYTAKEICRKYSDDGIDTISDPWAYTEEEKWELGYDYLHGDFDDSATNDIINDRYYEEGNWYDDEDFGFDPYQSAIDDREEAWDTIADLKKEIARYKDFICEFNLNTLYQRWLADNNS